jgi:SSS family transporter
MQPADTGATSDFALADWGVLGAYFVLLAVTGWWFSRRETKDTSDYFLGGRKMPAWAVAVSIVATSMSAASFIGVPQAGFTGDLTYLSTNVGMVLAAVIVAFVFIPAFYRHRVQSIYEVLDHRFGRAAVRAASATYMVGRVMASGVRVYIGAIPASIILFGRDGMDPTNLVIAIGVLTAVGICYTLVGGIASVIWTDVIQMGVLLGAAALAIGLIAWQLPFGFGESIAALRTPGDGVPSKLLLFDTRMDGPWWERPFTLPAVILGFTLMGIASYGMDQDLTQRMLTCRDSASAARSVLGGILLGIPSVAVFLVVGLMLYLYYARPDLWAVRGLVAPASPDDSRRVFLDFIIHHMPPGVSGLMIAGLFAAGLSSLNSGINAMASTFVRDFYRGWVPGRTERHYLRAGRLAVVAWGIVLGGFAVVCVFWERGRDADSGLLVFALNVMTFAYSGLIGVFLTALLTRRGNAESVIAALTVGFLSVLAMQGFLWSALGRGSMPAWAADGPIEQLTRLAFVWKLAIGATLAGAVCMLGRSPNRPGPANNPAEAPRA